jgi:hypothetical protein
LTSPSSPTDSACEPYSDYTTSIGKRKLAPGSLHGPCPWVHGNPRRRRLSSGKETSGTGSQQLAQLR